MLPVNGRGGFATIAVSSRDENRRERAAMSAPGRPKRESLARNDKGTQ